MARTATKKNLTLFHGTMHVTRVEHWCVEAATAEEAEALLASGEGYRHDVGECVHREVRKVD